MNKVNQSKVEVEHEKSPGGSFEIVRRHISVALGGKRDVGVWDRGHPFDVELAVIPKGKRAYPYHAHAAQTEYYIFVSGSGIFVDGVGQEHAVSVGDHVIVHPGEAHQVVNKSDQDLRYYVIADNHRSDVSTYPKTGKRFIKPETRCVRVEDAEYYLGEE
jgi:uncharacterized cupin superfamily protein